VAIAGSGGFYPQLERAGAGSGGNRQLGWLEVCEFTT
jgi:hypothetical protein